MAAPYRYSEVFNIGGVSAFPAAGLPHVDFAAFGLVPASVSVACDGTTGDTIDVSFDGVTVHSRFQIGRVCARDFNARWSKMWLRTNGATVRVIIEAEAK